MVILRDIIANRKCPDCNSKQLLLFEDTLKKKGLASSLSVKCCECEFVLNRYTSNVLPNTGKRDNHGMKTFDINPRSVYALRSCGVGHTGLEKICGLMNLPKPVARKNYDNISNQIGDAAKLTAERSMIERSMIERSMIERSMIERSMIERSMIERSMIERSMIERSMIEGNSMIEATEEEKTLERSCDTSVSVDGTWQKGFASLNGVVIAIGVQNGKLLMAKC